MSRLNPLPWHKLVCVFEQIGYRQAGQKGSHLKLEKPGVARPLIVPKYAEVGRDIITNLIERLESPEMRFCLSWRIVSGASRAANCTGRTVTTIT